MPTFGNKNSSGLRVLWIPGRKKHNHKGRYESTKKQVNYSNHNNKRKDIWSTSGGGNKNNDHEQLFDLDPVTSTTSSSVITGILPTTCVVGAGLQMDPNSKISEEEDINSADHSNSNETPCDTIDTNISEEKVQNNVKYKKKKKNKKNKNKTESEMNGNNIENHDTDEKIAKCLYVSLMCCECTIS